MNINDHLKTHHLYKEVLQVNSIQLLFFETLSIQIS